MQALSTLTDYVILMIPRTGWSGCLIFSVIVTRCACTPVELMINHSGAPLSSTTIAVCLMQVVKAQGLSGLLNASATATDEVCDPDPDLDLAVTCVSHAAWCN